MTNEEIKSECEIHYEQLKKSKERLQELRDICQHEHTFKGTYSWRVGAYETALICSYCGTPVSYPNRPSYDSICLKCGGNDCDSDSHK